MSINADLSEVAALAEDLDKAAPVATVVSSAAMTRIAASTAERARAAVAVDTGDTRASIHVHGGANYRTIIADGEAAVHLEFGTSDTAPQPFMWPQAPIAARELAEAMGAIGPFDAL